LSLRMKLFGAFFGLILVPLAVLGIALYVVMTGLMEDKFAQQTELTLRALGQNVSFLFSEMNKVTDSTIASDAIQDLLDNEGPPDLEAINYMQLNEVQKKFRELLVNHPSISNALLYTLEGGRIYRIFTKERFAAMPFDELRRQPVFAEVVKRDGLPYWVGPYEYPELTGREPVFTQIRVVKDIDTLRNKGILFVQIKPSGLEAVFRYFRYRQEQAATRFFIVNGRGIVLYDSGGEYNGRRFGDLAEDVRFGGDRRPAWADGGVQAAGVPEAGGLAGTGGDAGTAGAAEYGGQTRAGGGAGAADAAGTGAAGAESARSMPETGGFVSGRATFAGEDSIVSLMDIGLEDWQLVAVTNREAWSNEARRYAGWTAAVVWLCLLLACLFLLFFGNRVAKSITDTVRFMRRVERGDLSARLPVRGNDETALLARGFNSLVHRIAELLDEVKLQQERKREAELAALQAQIKPHFLFNTLESINGLAAQNQGRKVSRLVTRLGNMLRISILQPEEITVGQELDHLLSYLEIQHYRFEGLFDYEIDVPPELMSCLMLKLTLQPLVENCIQHGFEGIGYTGKIRVWAREEGADRIAFFVEDNGIGMPESKLAALVRAMGGDAGWTPDAGKAGARMAEAAAGESGSTASRPVGTGTSGTGERRGLGLANVAVRLRIRYGHGSGLMICSAPGAGTVVKMTIPRMKRGGVHETERAPG